MPEVESGGCRLSYLVEGPADAPPLLLINSLGTTTDLWAAQIPNLRRSFRVVRYDTRGHGRSDVSAPPYTIDNLGRDALAVLDAAGIARAHVAGISISGLTAIWLGLEASDRVGKLVLSNTAARIGSAEVWSDRIATIEANGLPVIVEGTLERWFTPDFHQRDPLTVNAFRSVLLDGRTAGYLGCCAALRDADLRDDLARITAPTLVIAGRDDVATSPADAEFLRDRIPGARMVTLAAAHLSNVEQPTAFTNVVVDFLSSEA